MSASAHADLLIVDNGGDYHPVGEEEVVRAGHNMGWAAASNLGFRIAFLRGYSHAMTLNSDTRLSPNFFAGVLDPRLPADAGLIGPMYDEDGVENGWASQSSTYRGAAEDYSPSPHFRSVAAIDGTCLCISQAAWTSVGGLDERSFGRFSWGADIDLALRLRASGFGVYITEMSFLNHFGRMSARALVGERAYLTEASRDLRRGMRHLYGARKYRAVKSAAFVRQTLIPVGEAITRPPSNAAAAGATQRTRRGVDQ
ncbi:glycosyltransferase family 2 protein [Nocardia sp. R7R-8]|uniref:glycosyltransferase family 2 protein n=1 Tax=Nocardia sp. R7R-8 TaxID=3459304 RepID=UPI00403E021C